MFAFFVCVDLSDFCFVIVFISKKSFIPSICIFIVPTFYLQRSVHVCVNLAPCRALLGRLSGPSRARLRSQPFMGLFAVGGVPKDNADPAPTLDSAM